VAIDVNTRAVTFSSSSSSTTTTSTVSSTATPTALASIKRGDDIVFSVRFVKNGVNIDLDLASIQLGIKELDPDNLLFTSVAWTKTGSTNNARYRVVTHFDSSALVGALSNYEADAGTFFDSLVEFEWMENAPSPRPAGWPATLRGASQTFLIRIVRDLIPVP
jgi:hypothetical protein